MKRNSKEFGSQGCDNVPQKHGRWTLITRVLAISTLAVAFGAGNGLCSQARVGIQQKPLTISHPSADLNPGTDGGVTSNSENIVLLLDNTAEAGIQPEQVPGVCHTTAGTCVVNGCAFPGEACGCFFLGLGSFFGQCW